MIQWICQKLFGGSGNPTIEWEIEGDGAGSPELDERAKELYFEALQHFNVSGRGDLMTTGERTEAIAQLKLEAWYRRQYGDAS